MHPQWLIELGIHPDAYLLTCHAREELADVFAEMEANALLRQAQVLSAFQELRVEGRHFAGSYGYGYGDLGRDTLEALYARVFGAQAALVRPSLISGTHALSACLFGLLRPGRKLLCATGKPYDTLEETIGIRGGNDSGSLAEWGVGYCGVDLKEGLPDTEAVVRLLREDDTISLAHLQRSRGYAWRAALGAEVLGELIVEIKKIRPDVLVMVDNCYGEFTEATEPTHMGADVVAGSCIKNPGGGLAPTGGYIAGRKDCIEKIAGRIYAPGLGTEGGSYAAGYREYYQGLFLAPHAVKEALKGAALAAKVYEELGFAVSPGSRDKRADTIQAVRLETAENLINFCRSVQAASPVEGHVLPEPWAMPGYEDKVIMAAGTFVMGATSELSADGPLRPPYIAYLQGGLTFEHCCLALMKAVSPLMGQ